MNGHYFDLAVAMAPTADGRWRRQRKLLARAQRRHRDQLTPHYRLGRLCGYWLPHDLYYKLDQPIERPPLVLTKYNAARALYCLNKYAKSDNSLYRVKDAALSRVLSLGCGRASRCGAGSTRSCGSGRWKESKPPNNQVRGRSAA